MEINRTPHLKATEYSFFSSNYENSQRLLGHLGNSIKFQKIEFIWIAFSDNSLIKVK